MKVAPFLDLVQVEVVSAQQKHQPLNSGHEAYAVILEEIDEFWLEVKKRPRNRNKQAMLEELIQIAAMCARTAFDLEL